MRYLKRFLILFILGFAPQVTIADDFYRLKKEFDEYRGSEYLIQNLVPAGLKQGPLPGERPHDERLKELREVQGELSRKKAIDRSAIEDTIVKNGIFEPRPGLWERLKQLDTQGITELLSKDYTLDTVLTVGLKTNLEVQRAYKSAMASLERYDQVSNLDEILNQYAVFTKDLELTIGEPMMFNMPVIMNFPLPGMLALKGSIVEKDVETSRWELKKVVQDVITEIKRLYYETAYIYDAIKITKEVLEVLHRMRDAVNAVYITGRSSMNDVVKIQMEIDRMENELVVMEEERKAMQVMMNKLLNIKEDFIPDRLDDLRPVILVYTRDGLLREGERERVEVRGLVSRLDKMRLMIEMAEKQFYPDFTPGFSIFQNRIIKQVGSNAEEMPFSDMPMVRGGNWFGKNDAYIRETKVKYQEMQRMIDDMKNMTVSEINEKVTRYENADRFRRLYGSRLMPKAELTVDIAEALYVQRRIDFMDLLNSQELYLRYNLKFKESIKEMDIEAARIERLIGKGVSKSLEPIKGEGDFR